MPDTSPTPRTIISYQSELERQLSRGQLAGQADWAGTIRNLMVLAKEASSSFDFDRAIGYLKSLEEIWDAKGLPEFSLELRFELHQEKGKAYASTGRIDQAIREYQKVLEFCRDAGNLAIKAETFSQIGQLLGKQGDHDRALGYLQRAIGACRRLKDYHGICKALRNIGVVYVELGEFEEAETHYDEAIELAEQLGESLLYADLVNNLGTIMNMRGDPDRALELYRKSLEIYEAENEIRKAAYTENNLAITLAEQGVAEEAFEYFEKAHDTATGINDASLVLIVNINLADLHLKRGTAGKAREHCQFAEDYLKKEGLVNGHLVETKKIAGNIALQEKDFETANRRFDEACEISREIGAQFLEAEVLLERGTLYGAMGRHFDALADLEASYHLFTSLKADGKREETEEVIGSIESLYLQIFDSIAKDVDFKDKYTKGHSDRVASLSLLLAKELGLRTNVLKTIVAAALLHDIGKINIEDSILKKPGKLTDKEFAAIQQHPALGVELLRRKEFPWDIKPLILHHHERYDGCGYPLGLKGEDIPLGARIICIADVFDALTSDRVYRPAFAVEKALAIMNEDTGIAFDAVLLKRFVGLIRAGKADFVINSRTSEAEMYSIWSQCISQNNESPEPAASETSLR
ncbi:MAG: tetratricopeptide repeat protein [bacterium]|nr:tetratricopeptide repeat protein [bacterium]